MENPNKVTVANFSSTNKNESYPGIPKDALIISLDWLCSNMEIKEVYIKPGLFACNKTIKYTKKSNIYTLSSDYDSMPGDLVEIKTREVKETKTVEVPLLKD